MNVVRHLRGSRRLRAEAVRKLAFLESDYGFVRDDADAIAAWRRGAERVAVTRMPLTSTFFVEWEGPELPGRYLYTGDGNLDRELGAIVAALRKDFDVVER